MSKKSSDTSREIEESRRTMQIGNAQAIARILRCEATILRTCALDLEAAAAGQEEQALRLSGDAEGLEAVSARARSRQAAASEAMDALRAMLKPLSEAVPRKDIFGHDTPSRRQIDLARRMLKNPVRAVTRNIPGCLYIIREAERMPRAGSDSPRGPAGNEPPRPAA